MDVTLPRDDRPAPSPVAAIDRHAAKVERVARQLREHDRRTFVSLKKKAVSHQVPKRRDRRRSDAKIDLTDLDEILEIDPDARTCTAEPGVTFVDLVGATLRYGLAPMVVPELKTITVAGAVSGGSLESTSFRYGGLHDTCLEYEKVLRCTPDNEHALVFQIMHGSFGTLGVLSKLRFRLVPAKPYVKMTYLTHGSLGEYKAAIRRHFVAQDVDFMDGIIHAPDRYVLCLGEYVDRAPYTRRYDWVKVY
jgi:FAD/FMN-containing dehydrogenase